MDSELEEFWAVLWGIYVVTKLLSLVEGITTLLVCLITGIEPWLLDKTSWLEEEEEIKASLLREHESECVLDCVREVFCGDIGSSIGIELEFSVEEEFWDKDKEFHQQNSLTQVYIFLCLDYL